MAETIIVSPQVLRTAASKIESLANEYMTNYNQLYVEMDSMNSTWADKANVAFITQIDGFKDDFKKMYQQMMAYAEYLRKSAETYDKTQEEIIQAAKKLAN